MLWLRKAEASASFNWIRWHGKPTLFVEVDLVKADLQQGGIHAGQGVCKECTKKVTEKQGHSHHDAPDGPSRPDVGKAM